MEDDVYERLGLKSGSQLTEDTKQWRRNAALYRSVILRDRDKERRRERKLWAIEYKGGVCIDCDKVYHHAAMQFHHLDGKLGNISAIILSDINMLRDELDRCVLLCANCHAVRHYQG